MAEYIEHEAFKKSVEERYCKPCKAEGKDHNGCWCRACWVDDMLDEVECFQPADVVPVGRCRDCAKYHAEIAWCDEWSCFEKDGEPCYPADSMQWRELEPDEYCSRFQGKEKNV